MEGESDGATRSVEVDWRNMLINGALVVLSVLLILSGFEFALYSGIVDAEAEYPHYEACEGQTTWQFHPEYGWTLRPNAVYLRQQNPIQERNLYRINSNGFRDTYDTGNNNSIIVLGDSQTAGWIVDDNRTYSHLLDKKTPETAVRNFGVPGYGTEQELVVYSNVSESIDHDLVVLGYYLGNDMTDNVDSNPRRPKFTIRDGELVRLRDAVNRTNTSSNKQGGSPFANIKKFLLEHTRTFSYLKPRIAGLMSSAGLRSNQPPDGAELDRQLRLTRALISELADRSDAEGADLLIVIIPERTEVNPENPAHYSPESGQPYWNAQRQMLKELSRQNSNAHVLDLEPHFSNEPGATNRLYGKANAHLDESGHRVTARVIYRWLVTKGYIADQPTDSSHPERIDRKQACARSSVAMPG